MKKKSIIISSTIVVIVVALFTFIITANNKNNQNGNEINAVQITVSVFDKESNEIYNKVIKSEKKYLSEVLEENNDLKVKMEDSEYGKYTLQYWESSKEIIIIGHIILIMNMQM